MGCDRRRVVHRRYLRPVPVATTGAARILLAAVALSAAACGSDDSADAPTATENSAPAAADFATQMQRCMADAGFEIEILEDGGISSQVAPEQIGVRDDAMNRCADDLGFAEPPAPLTDDQLTALYDSYVEVAECMADSGYPTAEPPSKQTFVDSGAQDWHPYDAVPVGSVSDFAALESDCPQP